MAGTQEDPSSRWATLIDAVKTPLNFFTLALLIAQGILVYLAQKAQGADFRILLVAALALTFTLVIFVGAIQYRSLSRAKPATGESSAKPEYRYDVFLSVPMAALAEEDYAPVRELALKVKDTLERDCRASGVYYAGSHIATPDWEPGDASASDDLEALQKSRFFVLLYPKKAPSSAIFEAGYALALGRKSLYFAPDRGELPYMMQEIEKAFPAVKVYSYKNLEDIRKVLTNRKCFDLSEVG